MKYFLIAGEASGDLHGSRLIHSLRQADPQAEFRFLGGDLMAQAANTAPLVHYRDMAFMGFLEVVRHLRDIMGFLRTAKQAIDQWKPQAVVLIDYPSFNLKVARHAHQQGIKVFYFISPKVWVWKEWRVKNIKRWVNHMMCILPFEPDFYQRRHDYTATYVGNPTMNEISEALDVLPAREDFCQQHELDASRPIIALVPGSRQKEIRDNLPVMLAAAARHSDYQLALAAAPGIDHDFYTPLLQQNPEVAIVENDTWSLIAHARVALVTSGTVTLETAILGTPQVACYRMNGRKINRLIYKRILKVDYVTLPNLIAGKEIIPELLLDLCSPESIDGHLTDLLQDGPARKAQLDSYRQVAQLLTQKDCAATAAHIVVSALNRQE